MRPSDGAAIGLGGVRPHLKAELNFHRLFEDAIADFDVDALAKRQAQALKAVGLWRDISPRRRARLPPRPGLL